MENLISFLLQNIITIGTAVLTLAAGYGYSKAKEAQRELKQAEMAATMNKLMDRLEQMEKRFAHIDTLFAVQDKTNETVDRHYEKMGRWMETIEKKIDKLFELYRGGNQG